MSLTMSVPSSPIKKQSISNIQIQASDFTPAAQELLSQDGNTNSLSATMSEFIPSLLPQKLDAGLYFNETIFKIGFYDLKIDPANNNLAASKPFKEINSASPEICFYKNNVMIGQDAKPYRYTTNKIYRYFNIFELLTTQPTDDDGSIFTFQLRNVKYTLCTHEIIAVFLAHLFRPLETAAKNQLQIGKTVMATPCALDSASKERLRDSARTAGYKDVEIRSVFLTSVIGTLEKSEYYKNMQWLRSGTSQKYLILDIQRSSFSLGIVEINPASVCTLYTFGSGNMAECQKMQFQKSHESLYKGKGGDLDLKFKYYVREIYKNGVNQISNYLQGEPVDCIVTDSNENSGNNEKCTMIESIFFEIMREKGILVNFPLNGGPLLGASLLASSMSTSKFVEVSSELTSPIIPKNIQISDLGCPGSDLTLSIECKGIESERMTDTISRSKQHSEREGCVFSKTYNIPLSFNKDFAGSVLIELEEVCSVRETSCKICRYQLSYKCDRKNVLGKLIDYSFRKMFQIDVKCFVDADGVYTLQANCLSTFPLGFQMQRVDNNCSCGNLSPESDYAKVIGIICRQSEMTNLGRI